MKTTVCISAAFSVFAIFHAAAATVDVDLASVKAGSFTAPGCFWDPAIQQLRLPSGGYFIHDSAWNPSKPSASGSFYNGTPGLNIVLGGDCSIAVSNVVAVSSENASSTNSVLDLAGHSLALSLFGENTFTVQGGSKTTRAPVRVPVGSTLSIEGDGALSATSYGAPAAIGSNYGEDSGTIRILGGTVSAQNKYSSSRTPSTGLDGAAIGSGAAGNAGRIEILGGSVTASSEQWSAAIGAGANYNGVPGAGAFDIIVSGGSVNATGGTDGGCGIGGGHSYARGSTTGACSESCPVRILGGTVSATAGTLGDGRANCASSAIGASMANAGAAVVIDAAATVATTASSSQSHAVVSGYNPVRPGSLSFACASGESDGHVFLRTPQRSKTPDVMPKDSAARSALPWYVFTRDGLLDLLEVSGSDSKGYSYSFPATAADPATAAALSAAGALSGLPITAFSIDGSAARFTYSRVSSAPTAADIAEFSAWFAAFGSDVVALSRSSLAETAATPLSPDPGSSRDNGDGTASFTLSLPEPIPPQRFFQLAW